MPTLRGGLLLAWPFLVRHLEHLEIEPEGASVNDGAGEAGIGFDHVVHLLQQAYRQERLDGVGRETTPSDFVYEDHCRWRSGAEGGLGKGIEVPYNASKGKATGQDSELAPWDGA